MPEVLLADALMMKVLVVDALVMDVLLIEALVVDGLLVDLGATGVLQLTFLQPHVLPTNELLKLLRDLPLTVSH